MSAIDLLRKLPEAFQADAAGDTECVVQFNISQPTWIEIRDGSCTVHEGSSDAADVTITMEDDDLAALLKGELNGMTAFMTGKLQIEGDLMLAQRMFNFFDASKLS